MRISRLAQLAYFAGKDNMNVQKILKIKEVEISWYSEFFVHGYLQPLGASRKGHHALPYHKYIICTYQRGQI